MIINPSERDNEDSSTVHDEDDVIDNTQFPNNDFGQYTIHDILQQQYEMNIAQVQYGKKKEAWEKIATLEGTEVVSKSSIDGTITWKVVKEVTDDKFSKRLEKEKEWLKDNSPLKIKIKTTAELFHVLWPLDVDKEFADFVNIVRKENTQRKKDGKPHIPLVSTTVLLLLLLFVLFKNLYFLTNELFSFVSQLHSNLQILKRC